jgi:hypothetical protein
LNLTGAFNFVSQVYENEKWLGTFEMDYEGGKAAVNNLFEGDHPLRIIWISGEYSLEKMRKVKENIRRQVGIGNHSIHSSDTHDESIRLSKILLNKNSLTFLNNGYPTKYKEFYRNLMIYKNQICSITNKEEYAIDGSAVLGIYGLRNPRDIDYISLTKNDVLDSDLFDRHTDEYSTYYPIEISEILINPRYYFYYMNIKFVDVKVIKEYKKNRNEDKDSIDIELIDSMFNKNTKYDYYVSKLKYFNYQLKFKIRFILIKKVAGSFLVPLLKKVRIYEPIRKFLIRVFW